MFWEVSFMLEFVWICWVHPVKKPYPAANWSFRIIHIPLIGGFSYWGWFTNPAKHFRNSFLSLESKYKLQYIPASDCQISLAHQQPANVKTFTQKNHLLSVKGYAISELRFDTYLQYPTWMCWCFWDLNVEAWWKQPHQNWPHQKWPEIVAYGLVVGCKDLTS